VQGRTVENQANLSPSYLAAMHARSGRGWLAATSAHDTG